jgi:hypothetical protein
MTQATVGDIRSGRDISEDELALYTENMKPLWISAGVETPTLNDGSGKPYRSVKQKRFGVTDESDSPWALRVLR